MGNVTPDAAESSAPRRGWDRSLIARGIERVPRWVRVLVGLTAVVGGVLVIARPTASLDLLAILIGLGGILEGVLTLWEAGPAWRWRIIAAALWMGGGAFVLFSPGLTVWALAYIVGGGLILVGLARLVLAFRGQRTLDERIAMGTYGVAAAAFGAVALIWRDISMVVVAVVFGAWLILTGAQGAWRAIRGDRPPRAMVGPSVVRRFVRTTGAVLTVSIAIAAVGITVAVTRADAVVDEFYAAPRDVPNAPGRLIRAETFDRGVPDGARGWRILYTTSHADGSPAIASALVVAPDTNAYHPVITWGHGTTGVAQPCAPSLMEDPFRSGSMYLLRQIIQEGWALVATDYIGLGTEGNHPYLIGGDTAHAMLDATRAARLLTDASLSKRTVIWGHSQGGGGALWAAQEAATYAPDLQVLGAVAVSPASDLPALVQTLPEMDGGVVLASYVLDSYTHAYADVHLRTYIRPGSEVALREFPQRCLLSPETLISGLAVIASANDADPFRVDPRSGPLGKHLRANVPHPDGSIPLMIVQGMRDPLILPRVQEGYVKSMCEDGVPLQYVPLKNHDHVSMLYGNSRFSIPLLQWTRDRFNYAPATPSCG